MATTPGGLPYPVGTDKVVDGDDAIRALALALDPRVGKAVASEVASFPLTATETIVTNVPLTPGTWDILVTAWADWSMTGPPRIYASLMGPGWILADNSQLFMNAATGSGPIVLQKTNLVVTANDRVDFAAYFGSGPTGSAVVKSVKLRALRVL